MRIIHRSEHCGWIRLRVAPAVRPGKSISAFDRNTGKPLSPETGYNFGGQLGSMQGIITTPNGDVWALDNSKDRDRLSAEGRRLERAHPGPHREWQTRGRHAPGRGAVSPRRGSAGSDLGHQWWLQHGDALSGERSPVRPSRSRSATVRGPSPSTASATPGSPTPSAIPARGRSWRWSGTCSDRNLNSILDLHQRPTMRPRCGSTCINS